MADEQPTATTLDHRTELLISRLLRYGVWTSLALLIAGTAISFATGSYGTDTRALFTPPTTAADPGRLTLLAGLVLLLATPVLRVVVSLVSFALQRDWPYAWITAAVLALLALSFILGAAH